MNGGIVGHP